MHSVNLQITTFLLFPEQYQLKYNRLLYTHIIIISIINVYSRGHIGSFPKLLKSSSGMYFILSRYWQSSSVLTSIWFSTTKLWMMFLKTELRGSVSPNQWGNLFLLQSRYWGMSARRFFTSFTESRKSKLNRKYFTAKIFNRSYLKQNRKYFFATNCKMSK